MIFSRSVPKVNYKSFNIQTTYMYNTNAFVIVLVALHLIRVFRKRPVVEKGDNSKSNYIVVVINCY